MSNERMGWTSYEPVESWERSRVVSVWLFLRERGRIVTFDWVTRVVGVRLSERVGERDADEAKGKHRRDSRANVIPRWGQCSLLGVGCSM